ncbi:rCG32731 [Rattus norvegicus]|uniref:RCG32731 n=1 Tax=Rattus norvegicus TaxID=10116 RepID=A6HFJ4_RAT|nr:rCG32731 [Rattus norvegicus]
MTGELCPCSCPGVLRGERWQLCRIAAVTWCQKAAYVKDKEETVMWRREV